jgi:urease subunit alpha
MFGAQSKTNASTSITFVSKAAMKAGIKEALRLEKMVAAVSNTRKVQKKDMHLNEYQPNIDVNPQTYQVRADGELLTCEPATILPMAQKYFLF